MTSRHPTTTRRHVLASLLLGLALLLTLTTTPARASEFALTSLNVKPFTFIEPPKTFGEEGTAPGDFGGGEESPGSVAVEQVTGDVLVFDGNNGRVEKFGPHGEFISEFNGEETPEKSFEQEGGLAVDNSPTSPSKGDVYIALRNRGAVEKFAPAPTVAEPNKYKWVEQLSVPGSTSLAVNSEGDLYVVEGFQLTKFGPTGEALGTAGLADSNFRSLDAATAPDGDLYIATFLPEGILGVVKLAFAPGPKLEVESESVFVGEGSGTAVAVDPNGNVYADLSKGFGPGENVIAEYESSGRFIEEFRHRTEWLLQRSRIQPVELAGHQRLPLCR